jgi:hypothetical protein
MTSTNPDLAVDTSASPNRRKFMTLFAGASLAVAGAALSGCSGWDMRADPAKSRPKTHINGRQGGSGGNMRKDPPDRP